MIDRQASSKSEFFSVGGALSPTAPSYVQRAADDRLFELANHGKYAYVLTPRQMGKTSLEHRTAKRLREQGIATARVDISPTGGDSDEKWYLAIVANLSRQLHLTTDAEAWWHAHKSFDAVQRFIEFLRTIVLEEIPGRIVIFIDEIDSTLRLNFSDNFFIAIRYLYNFRDAEPNFARLSFVLLGTASPTDLIQDAARTPFNIAEGLVLYDFTPDEGVILQKGLEDALPGQGERIFRRIYHWTKGHPYLTQKLCSLVVRANQEQWHEADIDSLVQKNFLTESARSEDNIQFVENQILQQIDRAQLLALYHKILKRRKIEDDAHSIIQNQLKLAGLVKVEDRRLVVRNPIYEQVFNLNWVRANTPNPINWARIIAVVSTLVAVLAVSVIAYDFYWIETQKNYAYRAFDKAASSVEKLHHLAKLFTLHGILFSSNDNYLAVEKFFLLPSKEKQRDLFKVYGENFDSDDLTTVIQNLYINLADIDDTGNTTSLLQAMLTALKSAKPMKTEQSFWQSMGAQLELWGVTQATEIIQLNLQQEIEMWLEGRRLAKSGRYEDARIKFDTAIALNPNNPATLYERAKVFTNLEQHPRALRDLDQIIGITKLVPTPSPQPTEIPISVPTNVPTAIDVTVTSKDQLRPTTTITKSTTLPATEPPVTTITSTHTKTAATPIASTPTRAPTQTRVPTPTATPNPVVSTFIYMPQRIKAVRDLINANPSLAEVLIVSSSQYPNLVDSDLVPIPTATTQPTPTPTNTPHPTLTTTAFTEQPTRVPTLTKNNPLPSPSFTPQPALTNTTGPNLTVTLTTQPTRIPTFTPDPRLATPQTILPDEPLQGAISEIPSIFIVPSRQSKVALAVFLKTTSEQLDYVNPGLPDPVAPGTLVVIPPTYRPNGETLADVAKKTGIPEETLRAANPKLEDGASLEGKVLAMPAVYIVPADTLLSSTADTLQTSQDALLSANPELSNQEEIRQGTVLVVPPESEQR